MSELRELVILIHGLAAPWLVMKPLERRLARGGYRTRIWRYASIRRNIAEHATRLARELGECDRDDELARVHLVTHSMGGIVARAALAEGVPRKLGRVVMLAPPNRGSRVATKLAGTVGWFCPPLLELADTPESYVNRLGPLPNVEVGVIASTLDWAVSQSSARVDGIAGFVTVRSGHGDLVFYPRVARLVQAFLQSGAFAWRER